MKDSYNAIRLQKTLTDYYEQILNNENSIFCLQLMAESKGIYLKRIDEQNYSCGNIVKGWKYYPLKEIKVEGFHIVAFSNKIKNYIENIFGRFNTTIFEENDSYIIKEGDPLWQPLVLDLIERLNKENKELNSKIDELRKKFEED